MLISLSLVVRVIV